MLRKSTSILALGLPRILFGYAFNAPFYINLFSNYVKLSSIVLKSSYYVYYI